MPPAAFSGFGRAHVLRVRSARQKPCGLAGPGYAEASRRRAAFLNTPRRGCLDYFEGFVSLEIFGIISSPGMATSVQKT